MDVPREYAWEFVLILHPQAPLLYAVYTLDADLACVELEVLKLRLSLNFQVTMVGAEKMKYLDYTISGYGLPLDFFVITTTYFIHHLYLATYSQPLLVPSLDGFSCCLTGLPTTFTKFLLVTRVELAYALSVL